MGYVSELLIASKIRAKALMMEAVRTSETSVNVCEITRNNIPEGSHLYSHHRENLKSHKIFRKDEDGNWNVRLQRQ
jgi:hypothetical protein